MKVVIIGAGNVATVFGRLLINANHQVIEVNSRNAESAQLLANKLGCSFSKDPSKIDTSADIYIVAMSDFALNNINQNFALNDKIVVHTAGSVSKEVLNKVSTNYGVIYPLQSLRKENLELHQDIPLLIDGNTDAVINIIEELALSISTVVSKTTDAERIKLHLAAVMVSNFTNHLYTLASDYCTKENLDFKMLQPLIEETALRLRYHLPGNMQTGPAKRKDIITLEKHLRLLNDYPAIKKVYLKITDSIMTP